MLKQEDSQLAELILRFVQQPDDKSFKKIFIMLSESSLQAIMELIFMPFELAGIDQSRLRRAFVFPGTMLSIFDIAAIYGKVSIFKWADIVQIKLPDTMQVYRLAMVYDHSNVIKFLVENVGNCYYETEKDGFNITEWAVLSSHLNTLKILFDGQMLHDEALADTWVNLGQEDLIIVSKSTAEMVFGIKLPKENGYYKFADILGLAIWVMRCKGTEESKLVCNLLIRTLIDRAWNLATTNHFNTPLAILYNYAGTIHKLDIELFKKMLEYLQILDDESLIDSHTKIYAAIRDIIIECISEDTLEQRIGSPPEYNRKQRFSELSHLWSKGNATPEEPQSSGDAPAPEGHELK